MGEQHFDQLSGALTVLSAMITPAVLISACGSLILATSQRLNRVIERTRRLAEEIEKVSQESDGANAFQAEERKVLYALLGRAAQRSRFLQQALASLYGALSVFVATSITIGAVAVTGLGFAVVPIVLGVIGAAALLWASFLLISESRIALASVYEETDFVLKIGKHYATAATKLPDPPISL